ncbi:MAG TPA: DUF4442 domain-containing protein [Puia sp.]|nr:DUF4442 domain-containing protein [Puia sp.]
MPIKPTRQRPASAFFRAIRHPLKSRLFLLVNLPSAFFSGLRVTDADADRCAVTVPYKWFTRNPFRSTYFACLSMAAEMSTGALAMAQVYGTRPAISMLVVRTEAEYFKKATGRTQFLCTDGAAIRDAIGRARTTGEAQTIRARSVGTNADGERVAEFFITWSFKVKQRQ